MSTYGKVHRVDEDEVPGRPAVDTAVEAEFDRREPVYAQLCEEVMFGLRQELAARKLKVHSVTHRVKGKDSFFEKISRKSLEEPFEDIDGIAGVRVVCLFLSELSEVTEVIRDLFDVLKEENKVEDADDAVFGYMSVHFVATLSSAHSGPRYNALRDLVFEIQVRTLLMDAWANVSHHLDYKGEASIPSKLRRDFHALSGLFYVADQHFELFYKESMTSRRRQSAEVERGKHEDLELNVDTTEALTRLMFPNRRRAPRASFSNFTEELAEAGYKTVEQLEASILKGRAKAEEEDAEHEEGPIFFTDIGMARNAVSAADDTFRQTLIDATVRRANARPKKRNRPPT